MSIRTIAGDCLVHVHGRRERTVRNRVLVVIKPDYTVLVHDIDGYQPVVWLTRPENLSMTRDPLRLFASDGDETLRIEAVGELTVAEHDATDAGTPVGTCRCGGEFVRTGDDIVCLKCEERFGLPSGASMTASACECGLPTFRVDRGESFELCLDYGCGSLLNVVRERFDREWGCPNCDGELRSSGAAVSSPGANAIPTATQDSRSRRGRSLGRARAGFRPSKRRADGDVSIRDVRRPNTMLSATNRVFRREGFCGQLETRAHER